MGREEGLCFLEYPLYSSVIWTDLFWNCILVSSITNASSRYNSVFEELSFAFFVIV